MIREAITHGDYRYHLTRRWGPKIDTVVWVMLNPSTADAYVDDPTIRRCISFSAGLGADSLRVINLYAYRATDPKHLLTVEDPVGSANDTVIRETLLAARAVNLYAPMSSAAVIVAWGANAKADRVSEFVTIADECRVPLHCLGITKSGMPRHPLYVLGSTRPTPWVWSG